MVPLKPLKPRASVFLVEPQGHESATLITAAPIAFEPRTAPTPEPAMPMAMAPEPRTAHMPDAPIANEFDAPHLRGRDPETTVPVVSRVVPFDNLVESYEFAPMSSQPVFARRRESVDDFYGFAPRPSGAFLPRMVTEAELRGNGPSFARRVARAFTSVLTACAVLAAVLTALALVLSYTFKVPVTSASVKTLSREGISVLTEVAPVTREPVAIAPLAVQPHGPVVVPVVAPPVRIGKI